jgi:sphingosine-1-phosphate phosphatase 1
VWACIMYIGRFSLCDLTLRITVIIKIAGQGVKDIIRWPRPGAPAVRVQKKWSLEYGMPSTHAMVGVAIPFSVLLYTMNRYQVILSI